MSRRKACEELIEYTTSPLLTVSEGIRDNHLLMQIPGFARLDWLVGVNR